MAQQARHPHPDPIAEQVLADLEQNHGWQITWDEAGNVFLVQCPHGKYTYSWPTELPPRWRWRDHFNRMNTGHKEQCPVA